MHPFNLKEALEGKRVVRRDGKEVIRVVHIPEFKDKLDLMALYDDGRVVSYSWNSSSNGKQNASLSDCDLFMAPEKKSGWVRIYHGTTDKGRIEVSYWLYSSKEDALNNQHEKVSAAFVEWEE